MQISIKDVHIRIEEEDASKVRRPAFGILLSQFNFHTVNSEGEKVFHDREKVATDKNIMKELNMTGMAVYLNPDETAENQIHHLESIPRM